MPRFLGLGCEYGPARRAAWLCAIPAWQALSASSRGLWASIVQQLYLCSYSLHACASCCVTRQVEQAPVVCTSGGAAVYQSTGSAHTAQLVRVQYVCLGCRGQLEYLFWQV